MALMHCKVETDRHGKELLSHGMAMFPIACYDEDFSAHLVPWHWHDDFELIMITEGLAHIYVENSCVPLQQGDALLINCGMLHSVNCGMPENALCHSLVFHPRLIGGSIDSIFWQKLIDPIIQNKSLRYEYLDHSVSWQADVIADMSKAWSAFAEEPEDYENYIRYLLSKSFRMLNRNWQISAEKITKQECIAAERTKVMMQFIHDHYTEELSLEQIAGSAAISKSVCLRCFRQVIDTTPIHYVMQYRIERAADLLLTTEKRAHEIATACGFSDISYFTKCFRELKGCTPLEYKKSLRVL